VFRARFQGSPIMRAKRRGFLRNVAVALGNGGDPRAVPALLGALHDLEPLVRGHAAWALGRLGGDAALQGLREALTAESDAWVREEIACALTDDRGDLALA
jgi:epoxyqueuosine reductase